MSWWHNYFPRISRNPIGLAWQLLTEKKPAARSAMYMAAAGVALTPLDLLCARKEKQIYARAPDPKYPIVLVCGPPRSGTTLVAQYLINNLDVGYLNNLTSLFPRSPIFANKVFGRFIKNKVGDYEAFYGKSRGLSGVNDALYIWDRWLGNNREAVPEHLVCGSGAQMREFFGAVEQLYDLPIVNKVNGLNTCANLVAEHLPNARFICVKRDPLYLAQSLYIARTKIIGDISSAYGIQHHPTNSDPVEDVCLQVIFYDQQARRQRDLLGEDRFVVVSYEEFCEEPRRFLDSYLSVQPLLERRKELKSEADKFTVSRTRRLPKEVFERLRDRLRGTDLTAISDQS